MKLGVLLLISVLASVVVSGCVSNGGDNGEITMISDGMAIDSAVCTEKGIEGKVVVFHSPTCPACRQTVPVLEDIEENETDAEFVFIDLSTEREKAEELGLIPTHIPTVIIKCGVHTGYKNKEDFLELIEN
jgi:thiol-disulfide isomerase/thioredoxin